MHCASLAHLVRQAVEVPHRYGEQLTGITGAQVPVPVQCDIGVNVASTHDTTPQALDAGATLHAPSPSHLPSFPHGGAGVQRLCGSVVPAATGLQVPALPVTLHASQTPQLAVPQHTPSTQWPPSHSGPVAQAWPRRLSPHDPALHTRPGAQFASVAHAELQLVPLHAYAPQDCVVAAPHFPAPSQVRASVAVVMPVGQLAAAHCVPAAYSAHAPVPLHMPVILQLAAPSSLQRPAGSGLPAGTAEQVPCLPATAHDLQLPEHAVVQQTPCAHTWPAHSTSEPHTAPGGLRPQEPPMHVDGDAQSALVAQDALHAFAPQT
jgi:hypothetical protein